MLMRYSHKIVTVQSNDFIIAKRKQYRNINILVLFELELVLLGSKYIDLQYIWSIIL